MCALAGVYREWTLGSECNYLYPGRLIELVGLIAYVDEGDQNKRRVTIVEYPLSHSSWGSNNITFFDFSNLLVLFIR